MLIWGQELESVLCGYTLLEIIAINMVNDEGLSESRFSRPEWLTMESSLCGGIKEIRRAIKIGRS